VKANPHNKKGKGATVVSGTVKLLHRLEAEVKKTINGDQVGCRIGLNRLLTRFDNDSYGKGTSGVDKTSSVIISML
jgi:hypothetical protein